VKALALIRRPSDGALLVGEAADPATGLVFHRSLGGHVEFGELASEAEVRELMEELGMQVRVGELLGVLENRFEFDGTPGHEIAFVLATDFVDPAAYETGPVRVLGLGRCRGNPAGGDVAVSDCHDTTVVSVRGGATSRPAVIRSRPLDSDPHNHDPLLGMSTRVRPNSRVT
jgi:ADP-ribose pyrophosphatase YjhB (NUDIX family)